MNPQAVDGQWLDFYALLEVPVNADEDTIRKRIGKVYSEAAANSEHRDASKRQYFQALVERVLPQCRRVLLDPEWRAKYDRQHILHSIEDPSAQNYVAFIASVRGNIPSAPDTNVPQRVQEEIRIAQAVVETVQQGESLELLPTKSLSSRPEVEIDNSTLPSTGGKVAPKLESVASPPRANQRQSDRAAASAAPTAPAAVPAPPAVPATGESHVYVAQAAPLTSEPIASNNPLPTAARVNSTGGTSMGDSGPTIDAAALAAELDAAEGAISADQFVHAKVITAQEAADIRRRRQSNPDSDKPVLPASMMAKEHVKTPRSNKAKLPSRVVVGDDRPKRKKRERVLSSTSFNLVLAITGVLLTACIERFADQAAVATSGTRLPLYVAYSSSLQPIIDEAKTSWERSRDGANFDLEAQPEDARAGLNRALGTDGSSTPTDVWIPSDTIWSQAYNEMALRNKREPITKDAALAQTPIVLLARSDKADLLRSRFPDHLIPSWSALRNAVASGAPSHFGMTDPRKSGAGAIVRFSMAQEWATTHGKTVRNVAQSKDLWDFINGFEANSQAIPSKTDEMVKDMVLGTTGRYWWGLGYESDALTWMAQGKSLEIFYLPRTNYASHPFCYLNRVGASVDTNSARYSFEKFMRSDSMQQSLLRHGFRPTEIGLDSKIRGNPFTNPETRKHGVRTTNLPAGDHIDYPTVNALTLAWTRLYS